MANIDPTSAQPQPAQRPLSRAAARAPMTIFASSLAHPLSEPLVLPALVIAALAAALLLPAPAAGALTAFLVLLAMLALRQAGANVPRLLLVAVIPALVGLTAMAVLDRLAASERAAERRAILSRNAALDVQATAPGSMLACLDAGAGEAIGAACETAIFATPQSTANAAAYVGARLSLLMDAAALAKKTDPGLLDALAAARRAIEIDRYGIAADILVQREGCSAERCAEFAVLQDTTALKAHMRQQAFAGYVSRYAQGWSTGEAKNEPAAQQPVAEKAPPVPATKPVANGYDFPSAASIPPVSIMNAEPPPPKEAAAPADEKPTGSIPVPPKNPQNRTAKPAAR
jgi:hypothetical protein